MNVDILETGLRTKVLRKKQTKKKPNPIKCFIAFSIFKNITVITGVFLQEYIIGEAVPFFFRQKSL